MRNDMYKVIVERPRQGGLGAQFPRCRLDRYFDPETGEGRTKLGMRRPWINHDLRKSLNENLAPLRRFIERSVGERWNDVFAEICENIRCDSAVQLHVRQHVHDFVALFVERRMGRMVRQPGTNGAFFQNEPEFYVDPESGVLKRQRVRRYRGRQPKRARRYIEIDRSRQLRRVNGVWYELDLADYPRDPGSVRDMLFGKPVADLWKNRLIETYGRVAYARTKQQLNTSELKKLRKQYWSEFERIETEDRRQN